MTLLEKCQRHFPAMTWQSSYPYTMTDGRLKAMTLTISPPVTGPGGLRYGGHWRSRLYTHDDQSPEDAAEFTAETFALLVVKVRRHLRKEAGLRMRIAGGPGSDSSRAWMAELEIIDRTREHDLKIALQESVALHIAELEAEVERLRGGQE